MAELVEIAEKVLEGPGRAVVRIGRGWGRGAGFVVAEGLVATNAHNLRGEETTVTFPGGRHATATAAGVDADGDLAALAVDTGDATTIAWPSGAPEPAVGMLVTTLALPPGGDAPRVTFGFVSAVKRSFRGPRGRLLEGIEHTAPLGRGSSGGPLLDSKGRLLGINSHRLGDGFYLAIPAGAALRATFDALGRGEEPTRRRLGISVVPPRAAKRLREAVGLPARDGVLVREVAEGTPAARAGLRRGDLIVAAAGRSIGSLDDLLGAIDAAEHELELTILRGTEELVVRASFAS